MNKHQTILLNNLYNYFKQNLIHLFQKLLKEKNNWKVVFSIRPVNRAGLTRNIFSIELTCMSTNFRNTVNLFLSHSVQFDFLNHLKSAHTIKQQRFQLYVIDRRMSEMKKLKIFARGSE